ncbi:hypothetical protein C8Q77DRAFT_1127739 [Trametes polyzona]|nr:hypothetical protein C8Q77DRAFT_1127739 [Trametes polyzona]
MLLLGCYVNCLLPTSFTSVFEAPLESRRVSVDNRIHTPQAHHGPDLQFSSRIRMPRTARANPHLLLRSGEQVSLLYPGADRREVCRKNNPVLASCARVCRFR